MATLRAFAAAEKLRRKKRVFSCPGFFYSGAVLAMKPAP